MLAGMSATKAHINPAVLRWAREQAGLSLEEAARRAGVADTKKQTGAERLEEWEVGEAIPPRAQVAKLAKAYYRPVLTFYMRTPPAQAEPIHDFRTVADHPVDENGNVLAALVRRMRARQQEVIELLTEEAEGVQPLPFVGRFAERASPKVVAADIREVLDFDFEDQRVLRDRDSLFRVLRRKAEEVGIFVLLQGDLGSYHTAIEPEEFRGIALADPIAPFIVINNNDAKAAHTFTLLHELAHIWVGATGVSNLSPFSGGGEDRNLEAFCNLVATEFLMPQDVFLEAWGEVQGQGLREAVEGLAAEFSISRAAAANRLWKMNLIADDDWWGLYQSYQAEWRRHRQRLKERDGGPGYHLTKRSQLGSALIRTVLGAVDAGAITYTRASRILGVNAKNFDGLRAGLG